ncbi:MAG: hypothetical protein KC486_24710 [Myxococcales bacterium]|nr:hypothetical protein [Myxococcales bacterium]
MRSLVLTVALAPVACTLDNPAFGERGDAATTTGATGDLTVTAASSTGDSATSDGTTTTTATSTATSAAATDATETCGDACTTTGGPATAWLHHYPRTVDGERMPLALLSDGSVVVGGRFAQGTLALAGASISTNESESIYVARIASDGALLWLKGFAGQEFNLLTSIATDSADRIYLAGAHHHLIDFGGGPLQGDLYAEAFYAILEADGDHVLSYGFSDVGNQYAHAIAPTADGFVLAGRYTGPFDLGLGPLPAPDADQYNYFIAGFNLGGKPQWTRGGGPQTATASIEDVAVAADGSIYAVGYFGGPIDLSEPELDPLGQQDAFVVKLGDDGATQWIRSFGSPTLNQYLGGVTLDDAGDVWVAGACNGAIDLAGAAANCPSTFDALVAKLGPDGASAWAWAFGGPSFESASDVAITPTGDGLVLANFTGEITIAGTQHVAQGLNDLLLVELDGAGAPLWSRSFGGLNPDMSPRENPDQIVVGSDGAVTFTAGFYDAINLDEPAVLIPGAKHSAILRFTY